MVQVEGSGKVQPAPHEMVLTVGDLRVIAKEAKRRCEYRRYGERSDAWGRGHVDGIVIPGVGTVQKHESPVFAGTVGEYAVGLLIDKRCGTQCKPDFTLRPNGDCGTDMRPNGMKIDVKARTKDYRTFLVRHANERGNVSRYDCDAFAFATWNGGVIVSVHGWLPTPLVLEMPIVNAMRGDHTNYEIQPCDLLPMSRLFAEIESRKLWL